MENSLHELITSSNLEWIFVGGKGGVGKTTTSCAIAVELAAHRQSVLILSTDPAHNLSDALEQKFSNTPTLVNGFSNLFAMEIDSTFQEAVEFRLREDEGWANILPDMMQALPGIDEALSFAELMQSVQTMNYSAIVFDTAPTGHTLRLLSFPDLLEKGLKKIISLKDKMSNAFSMINMISGQSVQEGDIATKLENLKAVTTSVRQTFQDSSRTTFVCVCIPEFLSVFETERLVQELVKQDIDCSHIVVNQVTFPIADVDSEGENASPLPGREANETLEEENIRLKKYINKLHSKLTLLEGAHKSRRKMQGKYLEHIRDLYEEDFHVVCVPQQTQEVRGVPCLTRFAKELLRNKPIPAGSES